MADLCAPSKSLLAKLSYFCLASFLASLPLFVYVADSLLVWLEDSGVCRLADNGDLAACSQGSRIESVTSFCRYFHTPRRRWVGALPVCVWVGVGVTAPVQGRPPLSGLEEAAFW